MKAVIVVNLPENTQIEDFRLDDISVYHKPNQRGYKLQGELVPMPQKKEIIRWDKKKYPRYVDWCEHLRDLSSDEKHESIKNEGFNECIDEILGGE